MFHLPFLIIRNLNIFLFAYCPLSEFSIFLLCSHSSWYFSHLCDHVIDIKTLPIYLMYWPQLFFLYHFHNFSSEAFILSFRVFSSAPSLRKFLSYTLLKPVIVASQLMPLSSISSPLHTQCFLSKQAIYWVFNELKYFNRKLTQTGGNVN